MPSCGRRSCLKFRSGRSQNPTAAHNSVRQFCENPGLSPSHGGATPTPSTRAAGCAIRKQKGLSLFMAFLASSARGRGHTVVFSCPFEGAACHFCPSRAADGRRPPRRRRAAFTTLLRVDLMRGRAAACALLSQSGGCVCVMLLRRKLMRCFGMRAGFCESPSSAEVSP